MLTRIAGLLSAFALLATSGCSAPPGPPRNVVVVSLDTLRADHLSLYGYERPTSPNLDRFAERTFVFENAVAPSNYTLASHHALFQSRHAHRALPERETGTMLAEILASHGFRTGGFTGGIMMSQVMGFGRGFDTWDEENENLDDALPKALEFLDEVSRAGERFMLFVHCFNVHLPYDPPPPYDALFDTGYRGSVTGPNTMKLLGIRKVFEKRNSPSRPTYDAADRERIRALYDGEIVQTDTTLKTLFERLDRSDLRDDTLVVILSDHGEEFWEHDSVLHAHSLYQELLHVPLLLRVPALERDARRIPERVSLIDVVPTLLDLLAVPAPAGLGGRSLVPLLRGESAASPVFSESFAHHAKLQSVIDGDLKLIRDLNSGSLELFDLAADPDERTNLAQSRTEDRERLIALLDAELGTGAAAIEDPVSLPENVEKKTEEGLRALGYIE
jgi:arylsulfatase A-like enzyme